MKCHFLLLPALALTVLFACNSAEEKKPGEDITTTVATIPAASFKVIIIQHPVKNFAAWQAEYLRHDSLRQLYGITHYAYGRGLDDTSMVIVIDKITDGQKAKDFSLLPELEANMKKAGVIAEPIVSFADIIRNDDTKIEQKQRLMVIHKVKDFDTWLKVYDGEGMQARKEHGLIDRGLGRGMDDPGMVYIVFAISDMEKAKARINSEELNKLMTGAGVEGPPKLTWYQLVD